ncbi:hypothetical protein [Pleurocapsa sp. FMAR1]|uniref:hypothetical protein n=1 Tax=Pleurocapsa sp. FMAR1 TaxID=3040204 RepID=UPI0029C9769B|nr:hypothetical protein [Pleurocapsa sp. FMAR1]
MKKIITLPTLLLLLSLASPGILQAQENKHQIQQLENTERINAFNLVSAAYRGRFKELGIPSYARLDQAYRGGQITALDLVKAAVEANQLSAIALEDKNYVNAVDTSLHGLVTR